MKKTFILEDLECAHCAAKIEDAASKLQGIENVSVNFIKSSMTVEADDAVFDSILKQIVKLISKIEPDCKLKGI